jgi:hypothetical protein
VRISTIQPNDAQLHVAADGPPARYQCKRRYGPPQNNTLDLNMFAPKPTETVLEGQWHVVSGKAIADDVALRIDRLIASYLVLVAASADGWSKLFRDPADGRLWEHTYPRSEMHGGGPARLQVLSRDVARARYGATVEV